MIEHRPAMASALDSCGWTVHALHPTNLLSPIYHHHLNRLDRHAFSLVWIHLSETHNYQKYERCLTAMHELIFHCLQNKIYFGMFGLAGRLTTTEQVLGSAGVSDKFDYYHRFYRLCGAGLTATPMTGKPAQASFHLLTSVPNVSCIPCACAEGTLHADGWTLSVDKRSSKEERTAAHAARKLAGTHKTKVLCSLMVEVARCMNLAELHLKHGPVASTASAKGSQPSADTPAMAALPVECASASSSSTLPDSSSRTCHQPGNPDSNSH